MARSSSVWRSLCLNTLLLALNFSRIIAQNSPGCEFLENCTGSVLIDETLSCKSAVPLEDIEVSGSKLRVCVGCSDNFVVDLSRFPYFTCAGKPLCGIINFTGGGRPIQIAPNQAKCLMTKEAPPLVCLGTCTPGVPRGPGLTATSGTGPVTALPPEEQATLLQGLAIRAEIANCVQTVTAPHGIIAWIAAALSGILVVARGMNRESRQFPDSLITLYMLLVFLWSINSGLAYATGSRIYSDPALHGLCVAQGVFFQVLAMSLMLYWFIILLVIYQIIVRGIPISKIREWQLRYHIVVWVLILINTVVVWGIDVLGPVPHVFTCWIEGDHVLLRIVCLFMYFPVLVIGGVFFSYKIIQSLRATGWSAFADEKCRLVSKQYIIQVFLFAIYFMWYNCVAVFYSTLSVLLEYSDSPTSLNFVEKNVFGTCAVAGYSLGMIGIIVFLIFGVTLTACNDFKRKTKEVIESLDSRLNRSEKPKASLTGPSESKSLALLESGKGGNRLAVEGTSTISPMSSVSTPSSLRQNSYSHYDSIDYIATARRQQIVDSLPKTSSYFYQDEGASLSLQNSPMQSYDEQEMVFERESHGYMAKVIEGSDESDSENSVKSQKAARVPFNTTQFIAEDSVEEEKTEETTVEDEDRKDVEEEKGDKASLLPGTATEPADLPTNDYASTVLELTKQALLAQGIVLTDDVLKEYIKEMELQAPAAAIADSPSSRPSLLGPLSSTDSTGSNGSIGRSSPDEGIRAGSKGSSTGSSRPSSRGSSTGSMRRSRVLLDVVSLETELLIEETVRASLQEAAFGSKTSSLESSRSALKQGGDVRNAKKGDRATKVTFNETVETTEYEFLSEEEDAYVKPRRRRHEPPPGVAALRKEGFV